MIRASTVAPLTLCPRPVASSVSPDSIHAYRAGHRVPPGSFPPKEDRDGHEVLRNDVGLAARSRHLRRSLPDALSATRYLDS